MAGKKTRWTPLSGGEEAYSAMDDWGTQSHYYEMAPLPSALFKDSTLARSTAEHTDYDPLLIDMGERDHGYKARGIFHSFMAAHNPITPGGRKQIKRTILSSGAASSRYATPTRIEEPGSYSGWRMGSLVSCIAVGICLSINTIFTIYALAVDHAPGGIGTLVTGSCDRVRSLDTWIHILLNLLGIALLGASNYTMQCLSAPNREEIDTAHAKGIWLDIGVPSVRNLRHISWRKIILWWLLAISSTPLHLLFNSAVFSTLQANDYTVIVVAQNFVEDRGLNCTGLLDDDSYSDVVCSMYAAARAESDPKINLTRLDVKDCIDQYANKMQSRWSNVLAVSRSTIPYIQYSRPDSRLNSSSLQAFYATDSLGNNRWNTMAWMCSLDTTNCNRVAALKNTADWRLFGAEDFTGYPIDHCLASSTAETCKLQFSLVIIVIVICSNVVKLLAMITTLKTIKTQQLITIGDAMETFLTYPDPHTIGACLATKSDLKQTYLIPRRSMAHVTTFNGTDDLWTKDVGGGTILKQKNNASHRWFQAPSKKRWLICIILCSSALIIAGCLLQLGVTNLSGSIWSLGFGAVDVTSVINITPYRSKDTSSLLLGMILLANLPQLILSSLYFMYNGLYTCMLAAAEWSRFAQQKKALRVTLPSHAQRCTYWLQLPWVYGLPLSIVSGVMHWLVSQSIFLARIEVYDPRHRIESYSTIRVDSSGNINSTSTCGYSASALIVVLIVGSLMVLTLIITGFRKLGPGIPLVGSCSLAISAACHRPPEDENAALKPVQWGAVSHATAKRPGHCCFTSFDVEPPVVGQRYAGLKED